MDVRGVLSGENNRCWKCLGGTKIKDYFVIPGLLQAMRRFIPPSTARGGGVGGSCGGSFSSGLAVWGPPRVTESERCLIWESEASLSLFPGHSMSTQPPATLWRSHNELPPSQHCCLKVMGKYICGQKKSIFVYIKTKKTIFFSNFTPGSIGPVIALHVWFQKQPIGSTLCFDLSNEASGPRAVCSCKNYLKTCQDATTCAWLPRLFPCLLFRLPVCFWNDCSRCSGAWTWWIKYLFPVLSKVSSCFQLHRNGSNIFRSSETVIGLALCPPKKGGFSNIKQRICTLTRICECLCKIKMNVRLKQTLVDYSINVTSCTSSFYPALLSYNVASLVFLTMI